MSVALRDAIVATIAARIPQLQAVEAHDGSVTGATFKRWSMCSPGVYVVCLGTETVEDHGQLPLPSWRYAAFVITRETPIGASPTEGDTGKASLAIVARLMALIHLESWGVGAQQAKRIKSDNRSSPQLSQAVGANLWVVSWQQAMPLTPTELAVSDKYIAHPRPLEGVDTHYNLDAPPVPPATILVTDEVSFP